MNRFVWPLLLGLLVTACAKTEAVTELDVGPGRPAAVAAADARDRVVKLTEPSTVYVLQGGRMRFLFDWRHSRAGRVTVPLGSLHDGSEKPLFVGVLRGTPDPGLAISTACVDCMGIRCCPGQK
jgi:hypothetical protein